MWRGHAKPVLRVCNIFAPSFNKVLSPHSTLFIRPSSTATNTPPNVVERVKLATTTNPIIALVGRPNVGKSTLFNRLLRGDKRTITDPTAGTTRDRTYAAVRWFGRTLVIVDTGGIVYEGTTQDTLAASIREQAMIGITEADAIVLVLDVRDGLTTSDLDVARLLRSKSKGKPIIVAVNKADNEVMKGPVFAEKKPLYDRLGLGHAIPISAIHGDGILDLVEKITEKFPEQEEEEEDPKEMRIAIVGAPNAGKSSLLNKVVGFERSVVSPVAGTTCDPVDTLLTWRADHTVRLIDTAGIRRKAHTEAGLQRAAVIWALKAIQRAHVVILLVDALAGVTEHDIHVAQFVLEHHKSVVVGINKWDLYPRLKREHDNDTVMTEKQRIKKMNPLEWHQYAKALAKSFEAKERQKEMDRRKMINSKTGSNNTQGKTAAISPSSITNDTKSTTRETRNDTSQNLQTDYDVSDTSDNSKETVAHKESKPTKSSGKQIAQKSEVVDENIDPELGIDISELEAEAEAAYESARAESGEVDEGAEVEVDTKDTVPQLKRHEKPLVSADKTSKKNGKGNWEAQIQEEYQEAVMRDLNFLPFVPVKFVSAATGFCVPSLLDKAVSIYYEREKRIKTSELLEIIKYANMKHKPPSKGENAVKLKFAAQAKLYPPSFVFWVSNPENIQPSYKKYLENCIRERYPFEGTPIRLFFRKNTNKYTETNRTGKSIWLSKRTTPIKSKKKRDKEKSNDTIAEKIAIMKEAKKAKAEQIKKQAKPKTDKDGDEGSIWDYEAKPRLERGKNPFKAARKQAISKVREQVAKTQPTKQQPTKQPTKQQPPQPTKHKKQHKKSGEEEERPILPPPGTKWTKKMEDAARRKSRK